MGFGGEGGGGGCEGEEEDGEGGLGDHCFVGGSLESECVGMVVLPVWRSIVFTDVFLSNSSFTVARKAYRKAIY